jgi:hypothetical protein
MPAAVKPLFRPEALRPKLSAFTVPPTAAQPKLADWARLLGSKKAETMKETELLGDFIADVFVQLLGYTGPASGGDTYTLKREATVQVDGKFADAALGRFSTADARAKAAPGEANAASLRSCCGRRNPFTLSFALRPLSDQNIPPSGGPGSYRPSARRKACRALTGRGRGRPEPLRVRP